MALRLLEVRLPVSVHNEAQALTESHRVIDTWCMPAGDKEIHRFLLDSEQVEGLVDALRARFGDEFRAVLLPVEATTPRPDEEETKPAAQETTEEAVVKTPHRISREELYEDIGDRIRLTPTFLALAGVSALVASVGLLRDDVVALIGAMVIAPLLGPNVALALATSLGDLSFARRALISGIAGLGVSFAVAAGLGALVPVDAATPAIAERIQPDLGHVVLALASGVAGGVAFTTGVPAGLIGVMVAVALMPPLAAGALLMGAGQAQASVGAFVLLGTNLVALNLAAVATFLAQGIRPLFTSDQDRARRRAWTALLLWSLALVVLVFSVSRLGGI